MKSQCSNVVANYTNVPCGKYPSRDLKLQLTRVELCIIEEHTLKYGKAFLFKENKVVEITK